MAFVDYQKKGNIAVITINRLDRLNALGHDVTEGIKESCRKYEDDEEARVAILTGTGRTFSAGADIKEFGKPMIIVEAYNAIEAVKKPVIAAVNGFALGGGTEIAIACDFIYASENAKFGQPEINLGVIPGFGGTQRLPRLIGTNMAKELIFTGKMISGAEALQIGLANKVVPLEQLMEEVLKTAKEIAAKGRVALREAKQAVNRGMDVDLINGCRIEIDAFAVSFASPDAKEGTAAFVEKRKAEFKGKLKG